ncbi:MAG TPA: GatB/YqeY domain-containing protein [Spirochaetota bacterium]|nr:GatB/YqeY domain-containing protein [Spirochaetota bacterium]
MGLLERIEDDLRASIKSKDEEKLRTLRMLKADILYEKTKGTEDLSEERVIEIVFRGAKKRKESIAEFEKAGRTDLADREHAELKIIEDYLPRQMSEREIEKAVDAKINEIGGASQKDMGKVMGLIMKELKGQADGILVKKIVADRLLNR